MKAVIEQKAVSAQALAQDLTKAKSLVVFEYLGLNAVALTALRKKLHQANAKMYVAKNNIFNRAFALANIKQFTDLAGPNAVLVGFGDEIIPFKEINEIIKNNKRVVYKNGLLETKLVSSNELASIASIPGRSGLYSMLLSCLQGSIRNLAYGIQSIAKQKA
ncbi:MAG: 50S ribosomal protein L10 [Mycoplasmataceae bacterium]|nr:50S ribosomal protein L10 [Mycoplasmataceae bacterium]